MAFPRRETENDDLIEMRKMRNNNHYKMQRQIHQQKANEFKEIVNQYKMNLNDINDKQSNNNDNSNNNINSINNDIRNNNESESDDDNPTIVPISEVTKYQPDYLKMIDKVCFCYIFCIFLGVSSHIQKHIFLIYIFVAHE